MMGAPHVANNNIGNVVLFVFFFFQVVVVVKSKPIDMIVLMCLHMYVNIVFH